MKIGDYYRRGTGATIYSPTFSRGGEAALFAIEILDCDGGTSMTAVIEHKNVDDTSWTTLTSLVTITSGVNTVTASAIMEQLRFAVVINGGSAGATVYANILATNWRPY